MEFIKYQHIERFGTTEVEGIEIGKCYIFPKIDGTNGSIWIKDGELHAGSRNRELSLDNDNAGFMQWVVGQKNIHDFLTLHQNLRLFGEWLVPHSLKTYRDDAWRRFYVFDVVNVDGTYLCYDDYKVLLDLYNIDYIVPICSIRNTTYEQLIEQLNQNVFLIKDGAGVGEGIVIKRYDYTNRYGRVVWAKIVTSEFKEKHSKTAGIQNKEGVKMVEELIAKKYITTALCEKVYAKIENDEQGWSSRFIPQLLNVIFYNLIKEDSWNFIKEHKNPTINFRTLFTFVTLEIKVKMPHLF